MKPIYQPNITYTWVICIFCIFNPMVFNSLVVQLWPVIRPCLYQFATMPPWFSDHYCKSLVRNGQLDQVNGITLHIPKKQTWANNWIAIRQKLANFPITCV